MPGPIAIEQRGDGWAVVCRLCPFRWDEPMTEEAADDFAYEHIVSMHPEVEEP